MKKAVFLAFLAFIFTGCFATMPDPVKDEYLVEQTREEEQKMNDIADVIIAKRKEKDVVEDQLKVTAQKIKVAKQQLPVLKDEKKLLLEKQKLYTTQKDDAKLQDINSQIEINLKKQEQQKAYIDYLEEIEDDQQALMELKHAELAVKVAELNVERARIARAYQEKHFIPEEKGSDKDAKNDKRKSMINVKAYEDYLIKQQNLLVKTKENKLKASESLKEAEKILKSTGYTAPEK